MGDQNKFEEYRQKLLQYWSAFLAFCGKLWNSVKDNVKKGWDFLSCHGKELGQKAAALLVKAVDFTKVQWNRFTAWLRKVREDLTKEGSVLDRAKIWCGGVIARLQPAKQPAALPEAEEAEAVETLEEPAAEPAAEAVEAPAAAVAAPAEETVPEAVEVLPAEEPAAELPAAVVELPAVEDPAEPVAAEETGKSVMEKIRNVLRIIGKWIRWLYKFVMAAPVVYAAVKLALDNMDRLPDLVGLNIQSSGEFGYMVTREIAVLGPLAITGFCLVLMFIAKKPILPWVISIFSLVLPILIWLTNFYA